MSQLVHCSLRYLCETPTTSFHETNKEQVPKINETSTSKFTHNNAFTIPNDENEDKSVVSPQEHLESHTEAAIEHHLNIKPEAASKTTIYFKRYKH